VVVVVRDVTRQRRTQLALRRSEERHRLLNERSESIVFRYRLPPEPGFEYVSAGVATQLGYAPEDFYVDERLLHAATHEDDRHVLDRALSPTPPHVVALRLLRRDGAVRWFELHLTVARDAEGVPVAVEGLAGDVTERRSADRELLQRQIEAQMQPEHSRTLSGTQDDLKPRANAVGWKPNAVPAHHRAIPQQLADHPIRELVAGIRKLRSLLHRSGRSGSGEI
jgi:PAS domain S-box-containing protein